MDSNYQRLPDGRLIDTRTGADFTGTTVDQPELDAEQIAAFWNSEAAVAMNRRDAGLKQLEIAAIWRYLRHGMRVLDVGCGDGETLQRLANGFRGEFVGVEPSRAMRSVPRKPSLSATAVLNMDVRALDAEVLGLFNLVYTERCLINLPTGEAQAQAIRDILGLVKPGGRFLMCEHGIDGLWQLNALREKYGLERLREPAHNRYLRGNEISALAVELDAIAELETVEDFAAGYYYASRILNAIYAKDCRTEPAYDSPINALKIPAPPGVIGYAHLWVWRKR